MSIHLNPNQFKDVLGFDWDASNLNKNLIKHKVSWQECEESFRNRPIILAKDFKHSGLEERYTLYGRTDENRKLTIIFTLRKNYFRIISARDQNKKERSVYEKQKT